MSNCSSISNARSPSSRPHSRPGLIDGLHRVHYHDSLPPPRRNKKKRRHRAPSIHAQPRQPTPAPRKPQPAGFPPRPPSLSPPPRSSEEDRARRQHVKASAESLVEAAGHGDVLYVLYYLSELGKEDALVAVNKPHETFGLTALSMAATADESEHRLIVQLLLLSGAKLLPPGSGGIALRNAGGWAKKALRAWGKDKVDDEFPTARYLLSMDPREAEDYMKARPDYLAEATGPLSRTLGFILAKPREGSDDSEGDDDSEDEEREVRSSSAQPTPTREGGRDDYSEGPRRSKRKKGVEEDKVKEEKKVGLGKPVGIVGKKVVRKPPEFATGETSDAPAHSASSSRSPTLPTSSTSPHPSTPATPHPSAAAAANSDASIVASLHLTPAELDALFLVEAIKATCMASEYEALGRVVRASGRVEEIVQDRVERMERAERRVREEREAED
ncbi:hypothetical protein JCM10207_007299 [Rhodosporidiobolus poonsookiae]